LGLNPLKDIGNHIVSLDVNKLEKVPVKHVPLEALPLINAMNQLLYQLRDAHELQRKFIEDAAHQLRTPIAGIQMQLELAVHGDQNDLLARARQSLNDIKRLTYINGQFLALARVSTQGTLQQEFETIDVSQLIMDRAPDWLRLAESSDIQIAFSLEPTTLKGIPWLVGELLDNLVFNAIKHGVGGKFITVLCSEYEAGSAKSAILSVEDCGPGIAEQDKKRIFQRFERGANSSVPGSGLGLSIVAEVCRIHGAQYELLDAEKGSGLLFKIVFPLNKSI
jgi:two-component system sensor histidine kinase TctE